MDDEIETDYLVVGAGARQWRSLTHGARIPTRRSRGVDPVSARRVAAIDQALASWAKEIGAVAASNLVKLLTKSTAQPTAIGGTG